jgi:2'-5' RNA ligase
VRHLSLIQSILTRSGPIYTLRHRAELPS